MSSSNSGLATASARHNAAVPSRAQLQVSSSDATPPNAKKRRHDSEDEVLRSVRAKFRTDSKGNRSTQRASRSHLEPTASSISCSRAAPTRNLFMEGATKVEEESRITAEKKASTKNYAPLADESAEQVATEVDLRVGEETHKICQDLSNQATDSRIQMKAKSEEQAKSANATSDLRSNAEEKDKKLAETEMQLAESKEKVRNLENALQEANLSWSHKMAEKITEVSSLKSAMDQKYNKIQAAHAQTSQQKDQANWERDQFAQEKEEALQKMRLAIQQKDEATQMAEKVNEANNVLRSAAVTFLIQLLQKEYPEVTGFQFLTIENLSPKLLPAFEATINFEQSLSWLGSSIDAFYSQNADELEVLKSTCPTVNLSSSQVSSASIVSDGTVEFPETVTSQDDMMVIEPVNQLQTQSTDDEIQMQGIRTMHQPQAMEDDPDMQEVEYTHQPQAMEDDSDMQEVQYTHQPQPTNATEPTQQVQVMANRTNGISEPEDLPDVADGYTVQDGDDEEEHTPPPAIILADDTVSDLMGVEPQGSGDNTEIPSTRRPRDQITCRNGSACRYLLNGNCWYAHSVSDQRDAFLNQMASLLPVGSVPSGSQSVRQTPCTAGERCKKPVGTCPYAHPDRSSQTTTIPAATRPTEQIGRLCRDGLTPIGCQNGNCTNLHPGDDGYPLSEETVNSMRTVTPSHGAGKSLAEAYSDFVDDLISAAEQSGLHGPNRIIYTEAMQTHIYGLEMAIKAMSRETLRTLSFGEEYFESMALRLANWSDPEARAAGRDETLSFLVSDEALATISGLAELDAEVSRKLEQRGPVEPVPDLPDYEDDGYEED